MSNIKYPLQYSIGALVQDFPKVQYAKIVEIIDAINKVTNGTITLTDVELGDGSVALPSLTFAADLDTGLYRIGANNIGLTLAGVKSVDFGVNLTGFTGAITASTTITATTNIVGTVSVLSPLFDTATAVAMTIGTTATSLTITPNTTVSGTLASGVLTVTGSGSTTTTFAVGTALTIGTDETYAKEVNHIISVATTTTAATVGGNLTIKAATGATSGNGGVLALNGGVGGVTAGSTGGALTLASGASGIGGGPSGTVTLSSPAGTTSTGSVTISTGNASAGSAGNVVLTPGTTSSTTVSPIVTANANIVCGGLGTGTIATGAILTGKQMVDGYFAVTGATGNVQMATAAQMITALGFTPTPGTDFEFIVNASGMTATNVATLTVNTGVTFLKQTSSGDSATSALATITQTAGVHIAIFKVVFDTTSTCVVQRIG